MTALTGMWFGGLVDHHHKKTVMMWSSMVSLIAYTAGLILYYFAPIDAYEHVESPHLWALILVLLVGVIVGNLRNIALPTLVTLLVKKADRANANGQVGMVNGFALS